MFSRCRNLFHRCRGRRNCNYCDCGPAAHGCYASDSACSDCPSATATPSHGDVTPYYEAPAAGHNVVPTPSAEQPADLPPSEPLPPEEPPLPEGKAA
ncbi:MAG: hypothetical protein KDA75_15090 [Planctomycetaceae bacterium]|nr:hypothetical protein [Planctomycetaceae bacterium]